MKVCFIGVGSIAKRHIKNLKAMLGADVEIDILRSGRGNPLDSTIEDRLRAVRFRASELDAHYDALFITNPTALHYETLLNYKHLSDDIFIEKPAFSTGAEDITPFQNDGKNYYVACPLRYTNVIRWLKSDVDFSQVYSMRCISSSYLPDWRPGTDYRKTYSAHSDQGGGVAIDLIHEWDYICHLIGYPLEVKSFLRRKSALEIDAEDIAIYIADYANATVEVHLDYFGRAPIRRLELYCRDETLIADLIQQKIERLRADGSNETLELTQARDDYQRLELEHFLEIAAKKIPSDNDLSDATKVLRIARGAWRS